MLSLIHTLWNALPPEKRAELEPIIRRSEAQWVLYEMELTEDEWLTTAEVARKCGVTPSAVRNWPKRYDLRKVKGRYRWGDIDDLQRLRNQREWQRHRTH
jgi:hypothetical protein